MALRYITVSDFEDYLELGTLTSSTSPKLSVVEGWIESAESEVDKLTSSRWDARDIPEEAIEIPCQTNTFLLPNSPLNSITKIEVNTGDEWNQSWSTVASSDYRILNANNSKIETKEYYWKNDQLRISYNAGYSTIPEVLKELTLLLTEKRYLTSRLGIAASDTELMSVASARIQDKTRSSNDYKLQILDQQIQEKLNSLGKSLKSKNYNIGRYNFVRPPIARYVTYS